MKVSYLGCIMAVTMLFAADLANAQNPEVKPTNDFEGIAVDMSSMGGIVVVFAGVREMAGKTAVCGVVFFEKPTATLRSIESKITAKLLFSIAGKRLDVQTSAFKRYNSEEEAQAGNARCWITRTPWAAAYGKAKLDIKLERGSISY